MTEQDKLRVMLGYWVQHNREHAAEFLRWVERAGAAAPELRAAAAGMEESSRQLARALERLGGPLTADAVPGRGRSDGNAGRGQPLDPGRADTQADTH
ncbi:MAG: hypothetical protein JW820_02040 [Spirochaetales bacterium]|nr:hypothetical protein [Spirochaetales bacterium]